MSVSDGERAVAGSARGPRTLVRHHGPEEATMTRDEAGGADEAARAAERRMLDELLQRVFADPAAAAAWLKREVPLLDGQRPRDLVARGELAPVIEVLAGFHAGVFL